MTIDEALVEYLLMFGPDPLNEDYNDGDWVPGEKEWLEKLEFEEWAHSPQESIGFRMVWRALVKHYGEYRNDHRRSTD